MSDQQTGTTVDETAEHYEQWLDRMDNSIRYAVRPDTLQAIFRYAFYGRPVGDFLKAVIANNLSEAMGRADADNRRALHAIVKVFYNYCPGGCWGGPEHYVEYLKTRVEYGPYEPWAD